MIAKGEQRRNVVVADQPDVTTTAAVPPIGAALGNVSLAAERDRPGPSVARLDMDLALVDEHRRCRARLELLSLGGDGGCDVDQAPAVAPGKTDVPL